ncbi:MAG: hypothetical protein L0K03_07040, partial [Bifidobacterium crudilactis]|nr:hypothetical protein [Bifidobacterium crudilactis]
ATPKATTLRPLADSGLSMDTLRKLNDLSIRTTCCYDCVAATNICNRKVLTRRYICTAVNSSLLGQLCG